MKTVLSNGYFAIRYTQTIVVYHESNPRQAVWETYSMWEARDWARKEGDQNDLLPKADES